MSKEQTFLTGEISAKVEKYASMKMTMNPAVIAREICEDHAHELADDSEFWEVCGFQFTKQNVANYLRKNFDNQDKQAETNQLVIEGFEYLQSHYIVEKDGDPEAVHISDLTYDQIKFISNRMKRKAKGLLIHARELEKYAEKMAEILQQ